jgi:tetratricopeptide (TPR) repeat protein
VSETEIVFYGKRLSLRRAPFAMRPGEEPDMIVSMSSVLMMCPLGSFSEREGVVRTCGGLIQMPLELAPSAFICPWCFSLLFIDESQSAARYYDADVQGSLNGSLSLFGYATYPNHTAQQELRARIENSTSGHSLLIATRYKDEGKQMFGMTEGRFMVSPLAYTEVDLESYLQKPSDLAAYVCGVGFEALQAGRHIEATGIAQRALVVDPEFQGAYGLLGTAALNLGKAEEAVQALQAALRINPDYASAHVHLGLAYGMLGRSEDEISEYEAALRIDPNLAEAHNNLGVEYSNQGRFDEAIRELQAALRTKPDHIGARFNLGTAYLQKRQWTDAAREFQTILYARPQHADAHHNLGAAYFEQGRVDDAIRELQTALYINPNDAETHCHLGIICWEIRRVDEAIREWQIAARLGYQPAREWLAQAGLG